jgi:hypothetical protein
VGCRDDIRVRQSHERLRIAWYAIPTVSCRTSLACPYCLPTHKQAPVQLLGSAVSLWISNVLVFASWYWRLDAGGPYKREKVIFHRKGTFLFPQMALHEDSPARPDSWHPRFIDYLFLSFNTSTALSPTDMQVLSRCAKALMMLQSAISLTIIVLLAARAVNIF